MANHKSAEKRARQNDQRRVRNTTLRSKAKTETKRALEAIAAAGSLDEALKALRAGERAMQKAASKGVLPKERASRKTARLAAAVKAKFSKKTGAAATAR